MSQTIKHRGHLDWVPSNNIMPWHPKDVKKCWFRCVDDDCNNKNWAKHYPHALVLTRGFWYTRYKRLVTTRGADGYRGSNTTWSLWGVYYWPAGHHLCVSPRKWNWFASICSHVPINLDEQGTPSFVLALGSSWMSVCHTESSRRTVNCQAWLL